MVMKMTRKILAGEDGFTLLEIMISIFILSVALITLSGLMTSTIRSTDYGRRATEAANLARETIEQIERNAAVNFDSIVDSVAASDPVAGLNPDNVEDYGSIAGHPSFKRETYITDGASPVNSKDIAVKVIWDDTIGSGHNIIFRTVIAR